MGANSAGPGYFSSLNPDPSLSWRYLPPPPQPILTTVNSFSTFSILGTIRPILAALASSSSPPLLIPPRCWMPHTYVEEKREKLRPSHTHTHTHTHNTLCTLQSWSITETLRYQNGWRHHRRRETDEIFRSLGGKTPEFAKFERQVERESGSQGDWVGSRGGINDETADERDPIGPQAVNSTEDAGFARLKSYCWHGTRRILFKRWAGNLNNLGRSVFRSPNTHSGLSAPEFLFSGSIRQAWGIICSVICGDTSRKSFLRCRAYLVNSTRLRFHFRPSDVLSSEKNIPFFVCLFDPIEYNCYDWL